MADIDALFKQLGGDSESSIGDDDSFANEHIGFGSGHEGRSVASSVTHDEPSFAPGELLQADNDESESSTNSRDLEKQASQKDNPELNEMRKLASTESRNVALWRSMVLLVVSCDKHGIGKKSSD